MRVRLDQIGEEPYTWNETVDVPAEALERPEITDLGPIAWRGEISRVVSDFLLRAHLKYTQTAACSRCLGPSVEEIDDTLELLIQIEEATASQEHAPDEDDEAEIELTEDEMGVLILTGHELDLDPLLHEQLQLAVPMRPLCKKDCRGLCPRCGAELNAGDCECEGDEIDPRWAALAALKGSLPDA